MVKMKNPLTQSICRSMKKGNLKIIQLNTLKIDDSELLPGCTPLSAKMDRLSAGICNTDRFAASPLKPESNCSKYAVGDSM